MKQQIKITKRQKDLLKIIYNFLKTEGFSPSFDDLKEKLNISSNQAILDHLESLEKKGLISREEKSARSIKIKPLCYKILNLPSLTPISGTSYAGPFTEAVQLSGEWKELSKDVKRLNHEVFIIKVSGDSMINAGINNGDYLLVQVDKEFSSGDIVLAQTSEGTTIKRFISQDSPPYLFLKPENPKYKIIYFKDDITMQGKIIGKYEQGSIKPLTQGSFI